MIDVQVADGRPLAAVLTLVRIAEHDVAAREAHDGPRFAVVALQVEDSRDAQRTPDDGQQIVLFAHRECAPAVKIVGFAHLVQLLSRRRGPVRPDGDAENVLRLTKFPGDRVECGDVLANIAVG